MSIHKDIPLQFQTERYGDMNTYHNYLLSINKHEMILAENASSLLAEAVLTTGSRIIERLLERIVMENDGGVVFPSFTFPNDPEKLAATIKIARKEFTTIEDPTVIYAVLGIDLGDIGGHHCAMIYEDGTVTLFDPMQCGSHSKYVDRFKHIAHEVFMTEDVHIQPLDSELGYTLQHTGGWMHIPPPHIEMDGDDVLTHDFYEMNHITQTKHKMSTEDKFELVYTSSEVQNHFCYMWCIWYLHIVIAGYDINEVVESYLHGTDPLVVIKTYTWCLLTYTNIKREIQFERFFNDNFKLVLLYNLNEEGFMRMNVCQLTFPSKNNLNDINDCLTYSFKHTKCIPTQREIHPQLKGHYDKVKNTNWSETLTKLKS